MALAYRKASATGLSGMGGQETLQLYEQHGDVDKVNFPRGYTLALWYAIFIYYVSADTSMAVATGNVQVMLHCLNE